MRTVSDHIALLQDDVDPENATEEEALLLGKWKKFQVLLSLKNEAPLLQLAGNAINYCIFITVLARI